MVHKILFWSGFGLAVRFWQLGIEMRPMFNRGSLWAYPVFAAVGGSFGYYLEGVSQSQMQILKDRRENLLEKRARRAEREKLPGWDGKRVEDASLGEEKVREGGRVIAGSSWGN